MNNPNLKQTVLLKNFRKKGKKNIHTFLKKRKVIKSDTPAGSDFIYTHVSLGNPKGCYLIEDNDLNKFYDLYCNAVFKKGKELYLVERHSKTSPLLIDIDLRFGEDEKHRASHHQRLERFQNRR